MNTAELIAALAAGRRDFRGEAVSALDPFDASEYDAATFGYGARFGDDVRFGDDATFGNRATFGYGARFGDEAKFGDDARFGYDAKFGDDARFGYDAKFGDGAKFGDRARFGYDARFARFGDEVSVSDPLVPVVPNLHRRIAEVTAAESALEMRAYHTCETTHCRAGWAIRLAGQAGWELEKRLGPYAAGALIYLKSTGTVPNFFASNEKARADIERCANESPREVTL
jgi:hypothetical protein